MSMCVIHLSLFSWGGGGHVVRSSMEKKQDLGSGINFPDLQHSMKQWVISRKVAFWFMLCIKCIYYYSQVYNVRVGWGL
jgi:hypothetical protein